MADVGRNFVGEFANFVFQFVFRSDHSFRESLAVKTEVPAAPEQVTTARTVTPAVTEGVPCWCPGSWRGTEGRGDLPGTGKSSG